MWLAAVLVGHAPGAEAQATPAAKAAAEALFDDGLKLMEVGKYHEACEKLRESQAIEPGIGTLLYLGECYAKTGRTASAWASFREAASAAQAQGQTARARAGTARADELEPQLSRLRIKAGPVNQGIEGFVVTLGSTRLSTGVLGSAFPVDPGEHQVSASAPGYDTWRGTVNVTGPAVNVELVVPPLAASVAPMAGATPTAQSGPGGPALAQASGAAGGDDASSSDLRLAGLVVGGAGVVALGLGTYFGLSAISDESRLEGLCRDNVNDRGECRSNEALSVEEDRDQSALLSSVFVVGGLGAVVAGAILYFAAPDAQEEAAAISLTVDVATHGRGGALWLAGKF